MSNNYPIKLIIIVTSFSGYFQTFSDNGKQIKIVVKHVNNVKLPSEGILNVLFLFIPKRSTTMNYDKSITIVPSIRCSSPECQEPLRGDDLCRMGEF